MPNGLHAILVAKGPIVRLDMYGFEISYDFAHHDSYARGRRWHTETAAGNQADLLPRFGLLERELWGKDKMFRGAVAPQFFMSNGSEARVPRISASRIQNDRSRNLHEMQAPAFAGTTIIGSVVC